MLEALSRVIGGGQLNEAHHSEASNELAGVATFSFRVAEDELDGGYVAECLDLPGCMAQGETEQEALENAADALAGVLEARMRRHLHAEDVRFGNVEITSAPSRGSRTVTIPV